MREKAMASNVNVLQDSLIHNVKNLINSYNYQVARNLTSLKIRLVTV